MNRVTEDQMMSLLKKMLTELQSIDRRMGNIETRVVLAAAPLYAAPTPDQTGGNEG